MAQVTEVSTAPTPRGERASTDGFALLDWGLLAGIALMWGSSFIFIAQALESFQPSLIALLRSVFGALTLVMFPKARSPIAREDWRAVALLGFFWMAFPFLMFPIAEQWIDSSLAGMINGGVPIFAALVASIAIRRLPSSRQAFGLGVGFVGVIAVGLPAIQGTRSSALGVGLVVLATISYGIAINIAVPLQKRYGSLPVLLRVQIVAIGLTLIPGMLSIPSSEFSGSALVSIVPLGCLGTALAFVGMTTLIGRVGGTRASIAVYFVPVVAIALGAIIRDEAIHLLSIVGTAMVLAGAFLASRSDTRSPRAA
jgi:drug/metabolite transporter (DMT)-like permease